MPPYTPVQRRPAMHNAGWDRTGDFPLLDVAAYLNTWGGEWRVKEKGAITWYQFRICPVHRDYDGHEWECGVCQSDHGRMGAKCMHDPSYTWQDFKAILGQPAQFYRPHIHTSQAYGLAE